VSTDHEGTSGAEAAGIIAFACLTNLGAFLTNLEVVENELIR
jgi:hypothetical protein